MGKILPTNAVRATYAGIKQRAGVVVTQGYLRLEQELTGATGNIAFNVLVNEGTKTKNERRLNITDAFTITSLSILIYKQAAAGNISAGVLDTFPNPLTYTGANEAASRAGKAHEPRD